MSQEGVFGRTAAAAAQAAQNAASAAAQHAAKHAARHAAAAATHFTEVNFFYGSMNGNIVFSFIE